MAIDPKHVAAAIERYIEKEQAMRDVYETLIRGIDREVQHWGILRAAIMEGRVTDEKQLREFYREVTGVIVI